MKKLNLQKIPSNRLKRFGKRAYIEDYNPKLVGKYILLKRGYKKPVLGQIIDSYTYMEEIDRTVHKVNVPRYFFDYFEVYLINDYEIKVYRI